MKILMCGKFLILFLVCMVMRLFKWGRYFLEGRVELNVDGGVWGCLGVIGIGGVL